MAGEYTRSVDRQLACARVQLDFARASEKRFPRTACLNACCLHLTEALLAYLHELQLNTCGSVRNGSSLPVIFDELRHLSQVTDFRLNEVITLAFSRQSWMDNLINLQRYFRKPAIPEQKHQAMEVQPVDDKLIATSAPPAGRNSSVEIETIEPSIDLIADIIEGMESLLSRHREFSAEY